MRSNKEKMLKKKEQKTINREERKPKYVTSFKRKGLKKIKLAKGDSSTQIVNFLNKTKVQEVIFIVPRNFVSIAEATFLKKVKQVAEKKAILICFWTEKAFFKKIIKQNDLTVYNQIPDKFEETEKQSLRELTKNIKASKNEKKTKNPYRKNQPSTKQKTQPKFQSRQLEAQNDSPSRRGTYFFGLLFLLSTLIGILLWITPYANIYIKPKYEAHELIQNIIIAPADVILPKAERGVPRVNGIRIDTQIAGAEWINSSDEQNEIANATGLVTLYNATAQAEQFRPSRLETEDGLLYAFDQTITIPPRTDEGPGSIIISIEALEKDSNNRIIGSRGNIEAGADVELHFPGLKVEKRDLYYAKANQEDFSGGMTHSKLFVSEDDREKGKEELIKKLTPKAITQLEAENQERSERENKNSREKNSKRKYKLISQNEKFIEKELQNYVFDDELIGKEQPFFKASGTLKISAIVFDEQDVINILENEIKEKQSFNKKMKLEDLSPDYTINNTTSEEQEWVKLSVSVIGLEVLDLEANNIQNTNWKKDLLKKIKGKPLEEARSILTQNPEIEGVEINISPFWNKSVPNIVDRIEFNITKNFGY